jgi:type II secretory pathway pseudopilin PulG
MKLRPPTSNNDQCRGLSVEERTRARRHRRTSGFTLAEVLAALVFMAIVIPVAVECLHVATQAGEVAQRKSEAARVAERILNESIVTTNWNQSAQNGTVNDGTRQFDWALQNEPWNQDPIRLLTVQVKYQVQGRDYSVQLSTLADGSFSSSMTNN